MREKKQLRVKLIVDFTLDTASVSAKGSTVISVPVAMFASEREDFLTSLRSMIVEKRGNKEDPFIPFEDCVGEKYLIDASKIIAMRTFTSYDKEV